MANHRYFIADDGSVWQLIKSVWGWDLYHFNNKNDFENVWNINYEAWIDGGFSLLTAKNFIKNYYNNTK